MAGGMVILTLGWRDTLLVFQSVVVTEQAKIYIAALDFFQINLVGAAIFGRLLLEQENLGNKTAQHSITEQKGFHVVALLREFLLHAADEYLEPSRAHLRYASIAANCSIILLNSASTFFAKSTSIWYTSVNSAKAQRPYCLRLFTPGTQ